MVNFASMTTLYLHGIYLSSGYYRFTVKLVAIKYGKYLTVKLYRYRELRSGIAYFSPEVDNKHFKSTCSLRSKKAEEF